MTGTAGFAAAIADASRAVAEERIADAIEALVVAWREVHDARIARAVAVLATELAPAVPIAGATKTISAREHAWGVTVQLAERGDIPRLLATPWPKTCAAIEARVRALVKLPADPRIVDALTAVIAAVDWSNLPGGRAVMQRVRTFVGGFIPATAGDPDATALLERIAARVAAPAAATEELVATVRADPGDRAALAVLGDSLASRGDPRGELIALQLAASARADGDRVDLAGELAADTRERALIDEHGRGWAGAISRYFAEDPRWFRDGFFAGGRVIDRMFKPTDPAWQHVRVLGASNDSIANDLAHLLAQPTCANVDTLLMPSVISLVRHRWPRISQLRLTERYAHVDLEATWLAQFPALRELAVSGVRLGRWLVSPAPPKPDRLARVTLVGFRDLAEDLLAALALRADAIAIVPSRTADVHAQRQPGWTIEIDLARAALTALYRTAPDQGAWVTELARTLAAIPKTWLRTIRIGPVRRKLDDAERARLRDHLEMHTAARTIATPWLSVER